MGSTKGNIHTYTDANTTEVQNNKLTRKIHYKLYQITTKRKSGKYKNQLNENIRSYGLLELVGGRQCQNTIQLADKKFHKKGKLTK